MTSLPETLSEFLRASAATASASAADDECVADVDLMEEGAGRGRGIVYRFRLFQRTECELGVSASSFDVRFCILTCSL